MKSLFPVLACVLSAIPCWANQADFDASGEVDAIDFSIFARAWRSHEGEPNWNPLCDISEPNDGIIDGRDLAGLGDNWCWTQILLEVYSDGWGNLLDTITMEEEGYISFIIFEDDPYHDPPEYYAYASRKGYYTELYSFTGTPMFGGLYYRCELTVDLDPTTAGKLNGVIFLTQTWFADSYLADTDVNVVAIDPNTHEIYEAASFRTDSQGRFAIDLLPPGRPYWLEFYECDWSEECYHLEPVTIEGQYRDFAFPSAWQALKPNIYIYPQETAELDVWLVFPHGGVVTAAIPDYDDCWHITVEPSGIINGKYEYLFYESVQPNYSQHTAGWVVAAKQLEDFFRNNMAETGFIQNEIDDFVEYWIPRLSGYPYYAIYPQYNDDLDEMIRLEFSTAPQNLIRLIYSIRGLETNSLILPEPVIPPFVRDGFTVAEWGVILY